MVCFLFQALDDPFLDIVDQFLIAPKQRPKMTMGCKRRDRYVDELVDLDFQATHFYDETNDSTRGY